MKIFITGISSGIGFALARQMANDGHQVWGIARRKKEMEKLAEELGEKLRFSICDIGNTDDMKNVAAEMKKENFLPDTIILSAGVKYYDVEKNVPFGPLKESVEININGSIFWISEFLPDLVKKGNGSFVAISSTSALRPGSGSISYPLAKSALDMAFRGLRFNFTKSGVRFITIRLGPIATNMWEGRRSFLVPSPEQAARFISSCANRRSGTYYFPFISTSIFRATALLPDRFFGILSNILKK